MIGLLQRVSSAQVSINNQIVASIEAGLLLFIGIEKNDIGQQADRLLDKILAYRVFPDQDDKMNLSLSDIHGGLLLVPQFTLPADTKKSLRPSFSSAATPESGKELFDYLFVCARQKHDIVESGKFAADMQVSLTNDGPVTFWLQIPPPQQISRVKRSSLKPISWVSEIFRRVQLPGFPAPDASHIANAPGVVVT